MHALIAPPASVSATARARGVWLSCVLVLGLLAASACDDVNHRDLQDEINILTRRNDALVSPATERLARYGRFAIPQIEVAMHTAAPVGRIHLVDAIDRVGDAEAIPVLRHFAVYDIDAEVREACEALLQRWAAEPEPTASREKSRRALRARAAILEIARKRAAGEAPLLFEGGVPGAPTVGAPEPVGLDLEKHN